MRARLAILMLGSAALGGCAYGYGGYGSPFGGLSVGVSYGSGYGRYGGYDPFCDPFGYGYGGYGRYGGYYGGYPYGSYSRYGRYGSCGYDPFWGWHGGYYYPGTGYYVYDRYRRPYRWSDAQRRYWSERRERAEAVARTRNETLRSDPNWGDFSRQRTERRPEGADERSIRRVQRTEQMQQRLEQMQNRIEQRQAERPSRSSARAADRDRRAERPSERRLERPSRLDTTPDDE